MQIVLGLGNPGSRYAGTRHNIGFRLADHLARRARAEWVSTLREHSHIARVEIGGHPVVVAKPQTYMNRSGRAARALCARFEAAPADVLVAYDDFLLDFGRLRLRRGGSDGGHNGLASVLEALGTQQVPRLRLGIGPLPPGGDAVDYVLSPFAGDEPVQELVERAAAAVDAYFAEGIEAAMNRFNAS